MCRRLGVHFSLLSCFAVFFLSSIYELDAQSYLGAASEPSVVHSANIQLPVTFEINSGQAASDVLAIARTAAGVATFSRNEMIMQRLYAFAWAPSRNCPLFPSLLPAA